MEQKSVLRSLKGPVYYPQKLKSCIIKHSAFAFSSGLRQK